MMDSPTVNRLFGALRRMRARKKFRDSLVAFRETLPDHYENFITFLMAECHVTRPMISGNDTKLREAEGRRKLGMSILVLMAEDDPQSIIERMEKYRKEIDDE